MMTREAKDFAPLAADLRELPPDASVYFALRIAGRAPQYGFVRPYRAAAAACTDASNTALATVRAAGVDHGPRCVPATAMRIALHRAAAAAGVAA